MGSTPWTSYVREKAGHALIGARQWIPREQIEDRVKSLVMGLPLDLEAEPPQTMPLCQLPRGLCQAGRQIGEDMVFDGFGSVIACSGGVEDGEVGARQRGGPRGRRPARRRE